MRDAQLDAPVGHALDVLEAPVEAHVPEHGLLDAQREVVEAPAHRDRGELRLDALPARLEPVAVVLVALEQPQHVARARLLGLRPRAPRAHELAPRDVGLAHRARHPRAVRRRAHL